MWFRHAHDRKWTRESFDLTVRVAAGDSRIYVERINFKDLGDRITWDLLVHGLVLRAFRGSAVLVVALDSGATSAVGRLPDVKSMGRGRESLLLVPDVDRPALLSTVALTAEFQSGEAWIVERDGPLVEHELTQLALSESDPPPSLRYMYCSGDGDRLTWVKPAVGTAAARQIALDASREAGCATEFDDKP